MLIMCNIWDMFVISWICNWTKILFYEIRKYARDNSVLFDDIWVIVTWGVKSVCLYVVNTRIADHSGRAV
jgi:hypothetical protein